MNKINEWTKKSDNNSENSKNYLKTACGSEIRTACGSEVNL